MIFNDISQFDPSFKSRFEDVFTTLQSRIADDVPGEYPIRGNDIFVKILHYETKSEDFITESHREYVDMQIVYSGSEIIRIFDVPSLTIKDIYNPDTDCQFYHVRSAEPNAVLTLTPGKAALFFPYDVHETQIAPELLPKNIKKAVVKIHVKFFT
jgi:biofilm protein TabA